MSTAEAKTIVLRKPVSVGKGDATKTYESIDIREPLAGEYALAEQQAGIVDFDVALTAIVAGVPVDVIDRSGVSVTRDSMAYFDTFSDAAGDPPTSYDDWTLDLSAPVELKDAKSGAVEISHASLELCEPTNQQRRKASKAGGPYATAIALIAAVANVPASIVKKLPASEFLIAVKYLSGFQDGRRASAAD